MGMMKEFKEFAMRGNVVDLAVGVVIGAAFGKIVSSLVADVITPALGVLIGGVSFNGLKLPLKDAVIENGKEVSAAVTLNYGVFLQTIFDFIIIAAAIFVVVKGINKLKKAEAAAPAAPPEPTTSEKLLTEIRDALKK
jgi:large conductance mechanosensitive channel